MPLPLRAGALSGSTLTPGAIAAIEPRRFEVRPRVPDSGRCGRPAGDQPGAWQNGSAWFERDTLSKACPPVALPVASKVLAVTCSTVMAAGVHVGLRKQRAMAGLGWAAVRWRGDSGSSMR